MGGYHLTFSRKICPNLGKMHFLVKHSAIQGTEKQYMGVQNRQKYEFYAKTSCDYVFQFIDGNNFCINTFWIGTIPWAQYISGQGVQGPALKVARPLIKYTEPKVLMGPI